MELGNRVHLIFILKRALETVPQSNTITIIITMNDHQHPPHFLHQDVIISPPLYPPPSLDLRSSTPPSGVSSLIYRICHHHHHHYHHQQHHHPRDHSNQCNNYKSVAISSNFTSYILMAPIGDLTSCQWKDINLKDSVNIAHWIFPDIIQWIFPDIIQWIFQVNLKKFWQEFRWSNAESAMHKR